MIDPNKGYLKNDKLLLEAEITVQRTARVCFSPKLDFRSPQASHSDGILLLKDVRLHVNKAYLSLYSPVLSALFFEEFREKEQKEVPIEDVDLEEFLQLLQVIYEGILC